MTLHGLCARQPLYRNKKELAIGCCYMEICICFVLLGNRVFTGGGRKRQGLAKVIAIAPGVGESYFPSRLATLVLFRWWLLNVLGGADLLN